MSAIIPQLAIRCNTDPVTVTNGVQWTLNLSITAANNRYASSLNQPDTVGGVPPYNTVTWVPSGYLEKMQAEDQIIPIFDAREVMGSQGNRQLIRTGYGERLSFAVYVEWLSGNRFTGGLSGNPSPVSTSITAVDDLDLVAEAMGYSTTGLAGDTNRYFWISPNYKWPNEQWILCEPQDFATGFGQANTATRFFQANFSTVQLYKKIVRTLASRGWTYYNYNGTVGLTTSSNTLTGVGTKFLSDFIVGDRIIVSTSDLGDCSFTVGSIASDLSMGLTNPVTGTTLPFGGITQTGRTYQTVQIGLGSENSYFYAPFYTFTTFTGTQSGWGNNWGNVWSGLS